MADHLQVVRGSGPIPSIPMFEGMPVSTTKLMISSTSGLDIDNAAFRADDIIRITVEARVAKIHHNVNEKTGELERVHVVKPLSVETVPWDPDDPSDIGVLRG